MIIARTVEEVRAQSRGHIGLVPTMGALHDGHLSLMRLARPQCDTLITSLFVNPTQFGPNEDYQRYPRTEERDASLASDAGVDILFAPDVETMYPESPSTIHVPGVTELWEGALRPGHFDGVATVVCKLFNITKAQMAVFGEKDFQQCAVIAKMVNDLNIGIELSFAPTIREANGLAMSSRNEYLSQDERTKAALIYKELNRASKAFGEAIVCDKTTIGTVLETSVSNLEANGFLIDYFALVDRRTLEPLAYLDQEARIIAAVRLGKVRLIDNIRVL